MIRGYDIDGVLAAFNESFRTLVMSTANVWMPEISDTYPDTWDYHIAAGVTPVQNSAIWKIIRESDFWFRLMPMPGAIEALALIERQRMNGDIVYFITSRPGKMAKLYTQWWLRNHGISQPTVIIAEKKGPVAASLGVELFVDDKPENCLEVADAAPDCRVYLVDRPYNRTWHDPRITRVASINEVLTTHEQKAA